jgi:hypothetical protein
VKDQLKHVLRRLMRSPMFTIVTLITVGVGVRANTAIFSVINGILLKPLPYPGTERLVSVWQAAPGLNLPEIPRRFCRVHKKETKPANCPNPDSLIV